MSMAARIVVVGMVLTFVVVLPHQTEAQVTVVEGDLGPGDPTFNRPSTSFPPCDLSSNGDTVYYDVHSGYFTGGWYTVMIEGTVNRPVLASYPEGLFNPASPCDDIIGVGGCETLPVTYDAPIFSDEGFYDLVVTTCYNGDSGSYTITVTRILFKDGFEGGDLSEWSGSAGGPL